MRRKKLAEVEILPPEDDQLPKGRKRLVEAEHTIKYSAPVPVTVEDDSTEDATEEDFDFTEEEKAKRRRKTPKDERDDFRRELDKLGVASVSRLKLSIDKYRHSDADDSGTLAEKDFCTKDPVTKEHILNEDYLATARKFGPGRYWFTLRMDNKIVRQWEQRINPVVTPTGPVVQQVNPNDPNSPQFIIQTNGDGQQAAMPSVRDIMRSQKDALKEHLEMTKLMREAYGFTPEQSQQPKSEEEILASAILKQPDVIENVVGSVIKRFGGKGGDDEPWYAKIVEEAVKSGQAAQVVKTAIDSLFFGFKSLFPGGQQNGQAEMVETAFQADRPTDSQRATDGRTVVAQEIPQGNPSLQPTSGEANRESGMLPASQQQQVSPEQEALLQLMGNCQQRVPPQIAFDQLMKKADFFQDTEGYSIDGYIKLLGSMPVDDALAFVKTYVQGEQVTSLEHTKDWLSELQKLIQQVRWEGEE
jgi:hypothetical protein